MTSIQEEKAYYLDDEERGLGRDGKTYRIHFAGTPFSILMLLSVDCMPL